MRYDEQVTALVLKKQPLGEADVLVTWYTRESGKLRTVVRAARKPQSRLVFLLQEGTVSRIRLVGRGDHGMPILAGGSISTTYLRTLTEAQSVLLTWFSEVLIKTTPDAQANALLFSTAEYFLQSLAKAEGVDAQQLLIGRTLMRVLDATGIAVHEESAPHYFSVRGGGFFSHTEQLDKIPVSLALWEHYQYLKYENNMNAPIGAVNTDTLLKLIVFLNNFLEYHIERPIRSFAFVSAIINR
jgi:DNA repair protein RecO (recombination protein O)